MKKAFLLFITAVLFTQFNVGAKELEKFLARGYVTIADTTGWVALDSVHVSLTVANDTTAVPFRLLTGNDDTKTIEQNGEIRLMVYAGRGDYLLTLDREGYEPKLKDFKVTSLGQDVVWLGSMPMKRERMHRLREVEVVTTAIKMVMEGDTIVYNADAFEMADGSMLDALVRQLPGAELTDGQIKVNGRFVNSLLVNGKDFFKGDPQVALQNLPAYTVKNVKVYDKAADDDYLTHASAKLARNEESENLVMDIVLKKEFSMGLLGSAEGGYGTHDRYLGKLFGMLFNDKTKVAAFANVNNTNNTDEVTLWRQDWSNWGGDTSGERKNQTAGITYSYDDDKHWDIDGEATYKHRGELSVNEQAATRFFPGSPNIYSRSRDITDSDNHSVQTNHRIRYKGDNVYLHFNPSFDWYRTESDGSTLNATFNAMPQESRRLESLDSVFAGGIIPERYNAIMLNRLRGISLRGNERTRGSIDASAQISPPDMRGSFKAVMFGSLERNSARNRTRAIQHHGGANTSASPPMSYDNYSPDVSRYRSAGARASYGHKFTRMDETWSRNISMDLGIRYDYAYTANDVELFTAPDIDAIQEDMLPSLSRPEDFIINARNSHDSRLTENSMQINAQATFSIEKVAPVDTGFNPSARLSLEIAEEYTHRLLQYRGIRNENILRREHRPKPQLSLSLGSGDKRRNTFFWLGYGYDPITTDINLFLSVRDDSNPLAIYTNNAGELKQAYRHNLWFHFSSYDRGLRQANYQAGFQYNKTVNQIGQTREYNEQTGVSVYSPRNIQGNWNIRGDFSFSLAFGPAKAMAFATDTRANYIHSVDYVTLGTTPQKSLVHSTTLTEDLRLGYKFSNGSVVTASGGATWQRGRSHRPGFTPINAMTYRAALSGLVQLPWDMQIDTSISMERRHGYETEAMNTTQWLWNATATKSILKGDLTFKVYAYDILGQIQHYHTRIDAQGNYEQWNNGLPRYVMVSAIYRFRHNPRK